MQGDNFNKTPHILLLFGLNFLPRFLPVKILVKIWGQNKSKIAESFVKSVT